MVTADVNPFSDARIAESRIVNGGIPQGIVGAIVSKVYCFLLCFSDVEIGNFVVAGAIEHQCLFSALKGESIKLHVGCGKVEGIAAVPTIEDCLVRTFDADGLFLGA